MVRISNQEFLTEDLKVLKPTILSAQAKSSKS